MLSVINWDGVIAVIERYERDFNLPHMAAQPIEGRIQDVIEAAVEGLHIQDVHEQILNQAAYIDELEEKLDLYEQLTETMRNVITNLDELEGKA